MADDAPSSGDGTDEKTAADDGPDHGEHTDRRFFELLATRGGREVLAALTREYSSVGRIVERSTVSRATVYRSIRDLGGIGIVEEWTTVGEEGGRRRQLRLATTDVTVSFGGSTVDVSYVPADVADRFAWLLGAFGDALTDAPGTTGSAQRSRGDAPRETRSTRDRAAGDRTESAGRE